MTSRKTSIIAALNESQWIYAGAKNCPEISEMLQECADSCHKLNMLAPSLKAERERLLRSILGSCGKQPVILSPFRCDFGFNIHIGDSFIGNFNLTILDEAEVRIGNNVMFGPNCSVITITHALDAQQRNEGIMTAKPVTIGNNVWIASNVIILPGVTIGDNSIIGAGSIVTRSIPSDVLAVGSPCKVLRQITDTDLVTVKSQSLWSN